MATSTNQSLNGTLQKIHRKHFYIKLICQVTVGNQLEINLFKVSAHRLQ